ncbi:MAG: hypothetical protein FWE09_09820 [Treponema sp.]|nr:hypothetical protein [Treponema sp.]
MKKLVCAAALIAFQAAAAGAADFSLSVGGGGIIGGSFTRYSLEASGVLTIKAEQIVDQLDYGAFAFLDATYVTLGLFFQNGAYDFSQPVENLGFMSGEGRGWERVLGISLLGKWPFALGSRFAVFPLVGIDYLVSLDQRREDSFGRVYDRAKTLENGQSFELSDWDQFHIRIGAGAEYGLGQSLFIRGDLLYGIRLMTRYETKNLDYMKEMTGDDKPRLGGLSSGPSLRLAIGWRFFAP